MIHREHITGAILAGGRGRRMNGADKGLVPSQGRPLITHVVAAIKPQVGVLILSANRNKEHYISLGFPVVSDHESDFAGPLAGIARVLEQAATPYVLIVPCDMPFLPAHLVARLAQSLAGGDVQAGVAHGAGRLQPLCVLLRRDVERDLRCFRESGGAKVEHWLRRLRHVAVDFSDQPDALCNINSPAELMTAAARRAVISFT